MYLDRFSAKTLCGCGITKAYGLLVQSEQFVFLDLFILSNGNSSVMTVSNP